MTVALGLLGPVLDRGEGADRWQKWRPTVALCQQEDLLVHRLELLHQRKYAKLYDGLVRDGSRRVRATQHGSESKSVEPSCHRPAKVDAGYGCGGWTRTSIAGSKVPRPSVGRHRNGLETRRGVEPRLQGLQPCAWPPGPRVVSGGEGGTRTRMAIGPHRASNAAAFHSHPLRGGRRGTRTPRPQATSVFRTDRRTSAGTFPCVRTTWSAACEAAQLSGLMSALKP